MNNQKNYKEVKAEMQMMEKRFQELQILLEYNIEKNNMLLKKMNKQHEKCEVEIKILRAKIIELENFLLGERMKNYSKNEIKKQEDELQFQKLVDKMDEIIERLK